MSDAKRIAVFGRLPERATRSERVATLDADIRDLTAQLRRKVEDKALSFTQGGYVLDDDSWEVTLNGHAMVLTAVVRRPA